MNKEEFWSLISLIDVGALNRGQDQAAIDPLVKRLSTLEEREIELFQEHLCEALYELDTEQNARASDNLDSDDGFLAARCFVVALGKATYESVLKGTNKMPKQKHSDLILDAAAQALTIRSTCYIE